MNQLSTCKMYIQVKRKLGSQSSASSESFMSQLDEELQSKLKNIGMFAVRG